MEDIDIDALIAESRAEIEDLKAVDIKIRLGGKLLDLEVRKLPPADWDLLKSKFPPRKDAVRDHNLGYNQDGLAAGYPAASLKLNAGPITQKKWAEVYAVLDSVNRENVQTLQYGLNIHEGDARMLELGKALMGASLKKRKPPVSSVSPSDDSEAGSQPK